MLTLCEQSFGWLIQFCSLFLLAFSASAAATLCCLSALSVSSKPTITKTTTPPATSSAALLSSTVAGEKIRTELHVLTKSSATYSTIATNSTVATSSDVIFPPSLARLAEVLALPLSGDNSEPEKRMCIGHSHTTLVPDTDFKMQLVLSTAKPKEVGWTVAQVMFGVIAGHDTSHTPWEFSSQNNSCVVLYGHSKFNTVSKSTAEQVTLCALRGISDSKSISATSSRNKENDSSPSPLLSPLGAFSCSEITLNAFDFANPSEKSL